jgi:hypothetical protein
MTVQGLKSVPEWRSYEHAVAAVLQALEPGARVTHDEHTQDPDNGTLRQRDVWIEMPVFGGQAVIKILVSCKRKKAPLSSQDLDHFEGERSRARAHMGILYSHGGYTKPALKKAAAMGVACCTLFEDRPADLPATLTFDAFCFRERCKIEFQGLSIAELGKLLDAELDDPDDKRKVLARLVADYDALREATMATAANGLRPEWTATLPLQLNDEVTVVLKLSSSWSVYRAKPEAWLLNGSYSFSTAAFAGAFSTPWVDQGSTHPGPGWEPSDGDEIDPTRTRVLIYSHGGEFASGLRAWVAENAAD